MTKRAHLKKLIEGIKTRARAEIEKMASEDFVVSESVKQLAESETTKISEKEYKRIRTALSKPRLHDVARYQVHEVKKNGEWIDLTSKDYYTVDLTYSDINRPKSLARKVNKLLSGKVKSGDLSQRTLELVLSMSRKFPKPGEDTEGYVVKQSYNPRQYASLKESIKFKKIENTPDNIAYVKEIAAHAYATPQGYRRWSATKGLRTVNTILKKYNVLLTVDQAEQLRDLFTSSHVFNILQKNFQDSEQMISEYANFVGNIKSLDADTLSTVSQMVMNEDTLDNIYNVINTTIRNMRM